MVVVVVWQGRALPYYFEASPSGRRVRGLSPKYPHSASPPHVLFQRHSFSMFASGRSISVSCLCRSLALFSMDLVYNCEAYSKDAKVLAPNGSKPGTLKFSIHKEIYNEVGSGPQAPTGCLKRDDKCAQSFESFPIVSSQSLLCESHYLPSLSLPLESLACNKRTVRSLPALQLRPCTSRPF
jgi:hypothetical protein